MNRLMRSVVTFSVLLTITLATFSYVYNAQPVPYMDEIFHIPQAFQFCKGNFSNWDPMITTLPGLYLVSVGVLVPVGRILGIDIDNVCSVLWLRAVNILFTTGNFYVIYAIMCKLHKENKCQTKLAVTAMTLSFFPLLYFFNFLYYTDTGSTFFVLFMYLLHLYDNRFLSSIIGVIAILFRQTNIIWVIFMAGLTAREEIIDWTRVNQKKKSLKDKDKDDYVTVENILELILSSVKNMDLKLFRLCLSILRSCYSYILVIIGFLGFIYINDGIVVGDRSHHTACSNFPQLFYFSSFTLAFALPYMITPANIISFFKSIFKHYIKACIFILIALSFIHYFTYVHVYLLSDNRHYTFYIWARLYNRHYLLKYFPIPVYMYSYWSLNSLLSHKDEVWKIVFGICLVAATIPQKLLEFRYFIIPYLIIRLNIKKGSWSQLLIELLIYMIVNLLTVYLFVNKPFRWENSPEIQRFMW